MRKLLLAFLILFSTPLVAQVRPSDVPTPTTVAVAYPTDVSTPAVIGDGSTLNGGTMPVLASQPADIPSTAPGWVVNDGGYGVYTVSNPNTEQAKVRFSIVGSSHIAADDPIRNFCQPGASHWHLFFGNKSTNACSTYASLRNRANTAASQGRQGTTFPGGPYNATAYWAPLVVKTNPFGDGKNYGVIPFNHVIYYVNDHASEGKYQQRIPRGRRFVFGFNMDDPDNCGVLNEISLANSGTGTGCTGTGTVNRYNFITNGFGGWSCFRLSDGTYINTTAGSAYSPSLVKSDGTDPWGGNCLAGNALVASIGSPSCYDGRNLWVPGGYAADRQPIAVVGQNRAECPIGWFRQTQLQITFYYKHQGWTDYQNWRLSSDDMAATVAGHAILNGASFHTDWFGGWDDTIFLGWQQYFLGINQGASATYREGNSSAVNATQHLIGGYVGEATPDGTPGTNADPNQFTTTTASGMFQIPANNGKGPVTVNAVPR